MFWWIKKLSCKKEKIKKCIKYQSNKIVSSPLSSHLSESSNFWLISIPTWCGQRKISNNSIKPLKNAGYIYDKHFQSCFCKQSNNNNNNNNNIKNMSFLRKTKCHYSLEQLKFLIFILFKKSLSFQFWNRKQEMY